MERGFFVILNNYIDLIESTGKGIALSHDKNRSNLYLSLYPAAPSLTETDVTDLIASRGIVVPLDREKISEALSLLSLAREPVLNTLIGRGLPAREGADGAVKIYFEIPPGLAEKINSPQYADVDFLSEFLVEKDQPLLRYYRPYEGEGGLDIFGDELPPAPPLEIKLTSGENVLFNNFSDSYFAAERGLLKISGARVSVIKIPDDYASFSIDRDMMKAYFSGDRRFLKAMKYDDTMFNALLDREGIISGIIREKVFQIIDMIRKGQEIKDMLIAEGKPPGKGRDGALKIIVENGSIIDKEDMVATISQAEPGEEGFTVKGKKLPSTPGRQAIFRIGKNLDLSADKAYICTRTKGKIVIDKDFLNLIPYEDGKVEISVGRDSLGASVSVTKPLGDGKAATFTTALSELSRLGISYGVDPAALKEAVETADGKPHLFASGLPPVNGLDSELVFLFSSKKERLTNEKIDHRNFSSLNLVKKGDVIVEKIPGKEGEDGLNVYGKTIFSLSGGDIKHSPGKNTSLSPDGLRLTADISGNVIVEKDRLSIVPILHVEEVNYKTGNINFDGDVFVKGDVLEGFSVLSSENIFINGNAYGAALEAGRNIVVRNIFGKGKATVKAGGDIKATVTENATLEAGGSIIIYSNSYQSNLFSKDSIIVTGGKGTIVGGLACAQTAVKAKFIGSEGGTCTKIVLGLDYTVEKKISIIEARINGLKDKLAKKTDKEPGKYAAAMKQLTALKNLRALLFEKMQIARESNLTGRERVEVSDILFHDVHIIIGSAHFKAGTKIRSSKILLSKDGQEIVLTSLY